MRARYEDILRVARRRALEVGHPGEHGDLGAGWAVVLKATRQHLAWLRGRLDVKQVDRPADVEPDKRLVALARAVGAGADLLAAQDLTTTEAFSDLEQLASARAEVASTILLAGVAVVEAVRGERRKDGARPDFVESLAPSMAELNRIAQSSEGRTGLGTLGGLAAGAPAIAADPMSGISRASVHWQRAHELSDPEILLTRDLRSITAQIRTVSGYAWHIASCLLVSPATPVDHAEQIKAVMFGLRGAQAGAQRTAHGWQRRLSDLGGQSALPGEVAFKDLLVALDQALKGNDRLLSPAEVITTPEDAGKMLDALDELTYSTHRVAHLQQRATAGLIMRGRLFVPLKVLVRRDPAYLHKPGASWRHPERMWAVTTRPDCFDDLTATLAWVTEHLADASRLTRELAGSTGELRPYGGGPVNRRPLPNVVAIRRRAAVAQHNQLDTLSPGPAAPGC